MGKETEKRSEVWAKGTYMRIRRERRASERTAWQGDWPRRGFREVLHWRVGVTDCLGEAGRRGRKEGLRPSEDASSAWGDGERQARCGTLGLWAHLLGRRQDGGQHEPKVLVLRAREAAVAMDRWIDGSMAGQQRRARRARRARATSRQGSGRRNQSIWRGSMRRSFRFRFFRQRTIKCRNCNAERICNPLLDDQDQRQKATSEQWTDTTRNAGRHARP
jgi:hypothetical protein